MVSLSSIDKKEIYRYLGYGKSVPDNATKELVETIEKKLLAIIIPRYVYRIFPISSITQDVVLFKNTNFSLMGRDIAQHLQKCDQVVLMAATLSTETDRFLRKLQVHDLAQAAIANSAANSAIEQICDGVCDEIATRLPGLFQTFRFSPGYGDLPLQIQKDFLTVLDAPRKIGLAVTESNIMVPEKSVSAVIGLSKQIIQKKRRGCHFCNLRNTCAFRLQGEHCAS